MNLRHCFALFVEFCYKLYLNIRLVSVVVCDHANSKFDFERFLPYSRVTFVLIVVLSINLNTCSLISERRLM